MPNANQQVRFIACSYQSYSNLGTWNTNTIYFCTDTQQIFLGEREYTKSIKVLDSEPSASTPGENGRMYVYNGNLYMCQIVGYTYDWTRIANVNDTEGTVTRISAGAGLSGGNIKSAGTISHAVPSGAEVVSDEITDRDPAFGSNFKIIGVETDEFGHVTKVNVHTIGLPRETEINLSGEVEEKQSLHHQDNFEVVVGVEKGEGSHDLTVKTKTYKLPGVTTTTYEIQQGTLSGSVKLVGSDGSSFEAVVKDWDKLAKITDITSLFKYKGSVPTMESLPQVDMSIGDVWYVEDKKTEYVYLGADQGWEEFGPAIDLSLYAKTEDVIPRVAGRSGQVAQFTADGTLESSGHTLAADVPEDAVFTDTVYSHPTHTSHELGLYKIQSDELGHVTNAVAVTKDDITELGIPGENTDTEVRTIPTSTQKFYLAGTENANGETGELNINTGVYVDSDGSVHAEAGFKGHADSATSATTAESAEKATADEDGRNIKATYATKEEVAHTTVVWEVI